jgi:hypothetical protein
MKKIFFCFISLFFLSQIFATTLKPTSALNASEIEIVIGKTGRSINLQDLSIISLRDFQQLLGKKLKLSERIAFKIAQQKIRQSINDDGTINDKILKRAYKKGFFDAHDFHLGGFALGFFLSLIGVLIAYLINDDYSSDRRYWAWRGFISGLLLAAAIYSAFGI